MRYYVVMALGVLAMAYVVASIWVATWIYKEGDAPRYVKGAWRRVWLYMSLLALWPFLMSMLKADLIELKNKKDKENAQEA